MNIKINFGGETLYIDIEFDNKKIIIFNTKYRLNIINICKNLILILVNLILIKFIDFNYQKKF